MKLKLSSGGAFWLGTSAVAQRVFFGVAIDLPQAYSSAWLVSILGAVFCLPAALMMDYWGKRHREAPLCSLSGACGAVPVKAVCAALAGLTVYEAGCVSRAVVSSASYIALKNAPVAILQIALIAVIWYACSQNGDAIGAYARLWIRFFGVLAVIVVAVEARGFRPGYLLPALGEGPGETLGLALRAGGWYALSLPLWLAAEPGKHGQSLRVTLVLAAACALATGLLALNGMLTPATVGARHTRLFQLVSVLANGRGSLSMQLPLIVMWFGGFLVLMSLEVFLSARFLQEVLPKLHGLICLAIPAALSCGAAIWGLAEQGSVLALASWQLYAVEGAFLALIAVALLRKGGRKPCASA